jgi:C1A family cysteine protease
MINRLATPGWRAETPDFRDTPYTVPDADVTTLPLSVNLSHLLPSVKDQGHLSSCVGHAVANLHYAAQMRNAKDTCKEEASRLFIYYEARKMQGWQRSDAGCYIRDAIKSVVKTGAAVEKTWPYDFAKVNRKPTIKAVLSAWKNQALVYKRVDNSDVVAVMHALAKGLPIAFGSALFESFKPDARAVIPMPKRTEKMQGAHAMTLIGYRYNSANLVEFLVRNSWGESWGDGGNHWMPVDYVCNRALTEDCWVLESVED